MHPTFVLIKQSELDALLQDVDDHRRRIARLAGYTVRNTRDYPTNMNFSMGTPPSPDPRSPTGYGPPGMAYPYTPAFNDSTFSRRPGYFDNRDARPRSGPGSFHMHTGNRVRRRPGAGAWQAPMSSGAHRTPNVARAPPVVAPRREVRPRVKRERRNGRREDGRQVREREDEAEDEVEGDVIAVRVAEGLGRDEAEGVE